MVILSVASKPLRKLSLPEEPLPDERPTRRREYSGASSTLGVAALIVVVVGLGIWFFEFRGGGAGSGAGTPGLGVVALAPELNPTGRAAAALEGRAAPNFRLATIDGDPATLDSFRGRYVLVNFWASWCGPCRSETPELQALYDRERANGLVILGVNQQEQPAEAGSFAGQFSVTYPILLDRSGEVAEAYRVGRGLPVSFLIDPNGVVRQVYQGQLSTGAFAQIAQAVGS
jgi:peroxiredoxin